MKTKNNIWIRLTTSIVIISLLYPNMLLAQDKHLAPKSNKKGEMQAVMICETIEKRARYGRLIERIYLDDILKWAESSEEEFNGCRFETLPHEIKIYLASDNIMVRYFDPSKAGSISGFKTKIIGPRLHRQIIHTHEPKALLAEKQDFKQPVTKNITPLSLLIIITASCLLISTFVFTFTSTLVLTSGAKLLFSMDIARLLPSLAALLGGFGIGLWILKQIEYGMDLLRKEPAYDLLNRIMTSSKERPKKPVRFTEYNYKLITNQPIEAITLGIKLNDSEIERLRRLSSTEDNARRYMLYYGNRPAGIVTVSKMAHGIVQVEVEWTSREGKRQLPEDFIITELANRNPAGILFHSADIDPEIIDRVLPNHSVADKKESARRLKEKVFSRLKIDEKGQYAFFAMDKQDFRERRRFYFGSFRFSSLWKMAEIDHWIYSFANGLFFALVFSSIFAHAEAIKVLAEYSFFEEYINLILTVIVAPLAARSIAKVIRMKWDPVRSRHGRRGGEDIWLSITQNMRMGWRMIGTFRILAYSRIFLSGISLLLIPAIGVVILGISSAYVYLSLMFLKLVSDRIINEYEERYYKEVSEVAILFNEAAKREGYAENFHNIDSTSDILRELIYASALLIGYGIFTCSILSPAAIPLAILAAIAMPISSFLVPTLGRDYKNYLKIWGKGFTQQSGGRILLAEGVTMTTNPDNPLVVHPRPVPVTDSFSILPWVEQLGVVIECKPGHIPIIEMKNPKWPRAKKGRCILEWPNEKVKIELISREKPLDIRDVVVEYKQDGGCVIRFYPKKETNLETPRSLGSLIIEWFSKKYFDGKLDEKIKEKEVKLRKKFGKYITSEEIKAYSLLFIIMAVPLRAVIDPLKYLVIPGVGALISLYMGSLNPLIISAIISYLVTSLVRLLVVHYFHYYFLDGKYKHLNFGIIKILQFFPFFSDFIMLPSQIAWNNKSKIKDRFHRDKTKNVSPGTPATLLRYMHANRIFSNNPKRSREMAKQRGGNDSLRTIQRELKVLKVVGLVEGDRNTGYYLPDWLKSIKIEDIISENPELNIADPDKKQIEVVKRRIRSRSQTAMFTMLNGVLRDFMPVVNASLAAVVLRHYPYKDASFAERLYDVIQRYSGLSSLEKLQEFNRLYQNDSIDNISALAAEANELKKALSSEVGISATGQKLLELFQHNLAFTISVDNPDYIKEVMGSNPSLLNAQGLLVDTLGNTGEANYDKFSHIDKVLGAYPGVKNVFLMFDAASEIKQARKIADRLKPQGKRVHVIGVVYPMSSATAREALKTALKQAGYTGGIDLDTLNLPDQSFESLSKTLVDAGADIVLSGLSSDLSQVMELYDRDKTEMSPLDVSDLVKKIDNDSGYPTYVVSDPLFRILDLGGNSKATAIPSETSDSLTHWKIQELLRIAERMNFIKGVSALCKLIEDGNVIFLRASEFSPRSYSKDLDEETRGRIERRAFTRNKTTIFHERLHFTIERLEQTDPESFERILHELMESNDRYVKALTQWAGLCGIGETTFDIEVLCLVLAELLTPKRADIVIKRIFSVGIYEKVKALWTTTPRPTKQQVKEARDLAGGLALYNNIPDFYNIVNKRFEAKAPGTPATLLRYMHENRISSNNPKKSKELAKQRGGNDSLRTVQRELKALKAVGLVEGGKNTGYYLPDWLRRIKIEDIIKENPELDLPSSTDVQIRTVMERVGKLVDANIMARLTYQKGKPVVFSLPKNPGGKYHLIVQDDFVSTGIFRDANEVPKHMIYVTTASRDKKQIPHPVGMATGIDIDGEGALNLEWVVTFDYDAILKEVERFRTIQLKKDTPLFAAMGIYIVYGERGEFHGQIKFLWAYLDSKLQDKSDEAILEFFRNAPRNLRRTGIGTAISEFLTSFAPIGNRIKFLIANEETKKAIWRGEIFENTLIGRWWRKLGYDKVRFSPEGLDYVLEKRRLPTIESIWEEPDNLGEHCIKTNPNVSCGTICESGHEGSYMALDEQLKRQFEELTVIASGSEAIPGEIASSPSAPRNDSDTRDLTEEEADEALVEYAKRFGIEITYGQLREFRRQIKEADEAFTKIQIFFSIPETGTELFWVGEDYAGGHFNRLGTRIHISLPIILKRGIKAGIAIAKHELAHIKKKRHAGDEGLKITNRVAEEQGVIEENIPLDTIERLAEILDCSKETSLRISLLLLSYFIETEKEFWDYAISTSIKDPNKGQVILHTYITEDRTFISIIGYNHSAVRFFFADGQLLIQEIAPSNRGNIPYENHEKLTHLADTIANNIMKIIRPGGITTEDLNTLFWAIPKGEWFLSGDGMARPFYNDEMYVILDRVNQRLLETGFYPDEKVGWSSNLLDDFGSMSKTSGTGYRLSLEQRIEEHHPFFKAFSLEDDEFTVFLARDAISAYEFLNYLDIFNGNKPRSGLVYQPGLPHYFNMSNYKPDPNLEHVQKVTGRIFYETKEELRIPKQGGDDEKEFDKSLYRRFSRRFKEKLIQAIEDDEIVRREAEFIYRQLKNIGALGYRKIHIVDLHATGRTIYYVKSVLEYFAEKEGIRFERVDGFIGYGRGENVGLPKTSHRLPRAKVRFEDVFWPFYMDHRDYKKGTATFYAMKSRYFVLLHTYHSLRLFNEAINYFRAQKGLSLKVRQKRVDMPLKKRKYRKGNDVLRLTKAEFLKGYRGRGYFRPGFFGKDREAIYKRLNDWFGEGNWQVCHLINGEPVPLRKALELYEDSYVEYFRNHPEQLDWLVKEAKNVYDNSITNINSGIDYDKQETPDHHFHDIAIRRAVMKLGRRFEGIKYIQIRGFLSPGYHLNPGLVPFHRSELILEPQLKGWWKPNSIEAFYQSNKVIVLKEDVNVSCGTICESGHEGSYDALDEQLKRQFEELRRILRKNVIASGSEAIPDKIASSPSAPRNDGVSQDLTEEEADRALVVYAKRFGIKITYKELQEYRRQIKEADEALKKIQIFFSIPETGTGLFWVGKDYAGGHFNGAGTRIHVSLPIILKWGIQAGIGIAMHELQHIKNGIHLDNDQGSEMVRKIAAIEKFKKMYGQEILRRIHGEERYRLFADKRELDINTLQEVIYEREMRFCEHILDHLITILERANGRLGRERIFVINTSMLYDVDETIGTFSIGGWHIRPSIPFLFRFLRDNFNIKIGIVSSRGKESLDKQLQPGYEGPGTLAEISSFVEPVCVYSLSDIQRDSLHGKSNTIFPGFKIFDPKATLRGLGWDEEWIDRFEKVIGPGLFKELKKDGCAWRYDNLNDPEQKRRLEEEVEESFNDILIRPDTIGQMLDAVRNLYIYFFAPGNKKTDNKRSEILSKLGEFGLNLSDLETLAKICGEYSGLQNKQRAENRRVIDEFRRRISDILGLEEGRENFVINAVYRLAAAKDLLDKGVSEVSVTIDNAYDVAEGLYELFIGIRRGPNGEDGFTLFGLDKYRDRLFIFSTSKDGMYSDTNIVYTAERREVEKAFELKSNQVDNPIKALLFDLDGTLMPTVRNISVRALAWSYAKYILGNTEAETIERAYEIVSQTRERIAREQGSTATVSAVRDALGITLEQQKEGKRVVSIPKLREIIKRDEEQIRLFERLNKYYKLGAVTNLDIEMTEYTLNLLGLRHFFSVIVTPEEVGKKKKPDPIFLRTAAERLGIPCRQCASIGDLYPQDGKPAHELGMHYIEVNNPADLVSNLESRLISLIDTILHTERFIDTVKSVPEKNKDRKILLALDTDIGNMTQFEIDELLRQIRDVSSLLGDIEFVAGTGETLAGLIKDAKSRIKTHNIDVIVVTRKKKEDFDSSYHVVRTDDSRLDSGSYVPILELLTFALLINLENNDVLLREIYKEITGNELTGKLKGQIKNGIFAIPLPPSERISPDFYNTSIEVLKSA